MIAVVQFGFAITPLCTEQRDVDALERVVRHLLDDHVLALELHRLAGGTGGSQKFEVLHREIPLFERLDHFDADRTGRTRDRNIESVRHTVSSFGN